MIAGQTPPVQIRHVQSDVCLRWKGAPSIVALFALPANTPSLPGTLSISTEYVVRWWSLLCLIFPSFHPPIHPFTHSQSQLYWYCAEIGKGFALDYPSIQLHALSRKTPELAAHLYLQVDLKGWVSENGESAANNDHGDDDDEDTITELLLFPQDEGAGRWHGDRPGLQHPLVDILFEAFCECANLHPDASSDDEDGDDPLETNGDHHHKDGNDSDDDEETTAKRARLEDMARDAMARFHDADGPLH